MSNFSARKLLESLLMSLFAKDRANKLTKNSSSVMTGLETTWASLRQSGRAGAANASDRSSFLEALSANRPRGSLKARQSVVDFLGCLEPRRGRNKLEGLQVGSAVRHDQVHED